MFKATHDRGCVCGLAIDYPEVEDDSLGRLTVFFDDDTSSSARTLFLKFINSQLEQMAFGGSIQRERVYHCRVCDLFVEARAVEIAKSNGKTRVNCSACEKKFALDDLVEVSQQPDLRLEDIDRQAAIRQRLAGMVTTIDERRNDGAFDVFLCHNSADKPGVRELAKELADQGLLGWIDEEQLLPGDVIQAKLERAIEETGVIVVCIGPHGLGRWQTVEYHTVYERFVRESEHGDERDRNFIGERLRVIPVLMPGAEKRDIPAFLRRHLYVDLSSSAVGKHRDEMRKLITAIFTNARGQR